MNTNNILSFPKSKIVREGVDIEPVRKAKEKSAKNYADSIVDEATDALLEIFKRIFIVGDCPDNHEFHLPRNEYDAHHPVCNSYLCTNTISNSLCILGATWA